MNTAQGLVMDAEYDQYQQLQQQLQQMSQAEIDQMNAVLSQYQMVPAGGDGLDGDNLFGDDENYHFGQQQQQQAQQQHTQYLQTIYLQQLQLQNEQMRQIEEAVARDREQRARNLASASSSASPSHPQSHPLVHLQQPFPHDAPPFGATPQQLHYDLQHQQQLPPPQQQPPLPPQQRTPPVTWPQGGAGVSAASVPIRHATVNQGRPSRGRTHARMASASASSARQHTQPPTVEPAATTAAPASAPAPVDAPAANGNNSNNSNNTTDDEQLLRLQDLSIMHRSEEEAAATASSLSSMTRSVSTATITGPTSSASPTRPPVPQLLYLPSNPRPSSPSHSSQSHSHSHHLQPSAHPPLPPHPLHSQHPQQPLPNSQPVHPYPNHQTSASCSSLPLDNIPLPPSHQPTLSPRKQRTASSSPKKTGRFESIYATLRNKATNMRRSRTTFMHEAAPPTVAPMATLNDAGMPEVSKSHHAHYHSHPTGDLDLDLGLSAAHAAVMGNYPPTPPPTGTASSLSSTSSTFSTSACSSVASSVGDGPQFHHLVTAQFPQHSLHNHHHLVHHHQNVSEEDLHPAEMSTFVSGLVDDPFANTNAFFGGGGAPGPQPHPQHAMLALRPHVKTEYPPQPQSQPPSSGVSSACWPVTASTPSAKASPQRHQGEDNDATPVTAAINIPGHGNGNGLTVSPTAYLANAAANMSGSSVIASASATAAMAAMAANMKHDPSATAMDTDEDWWQQSVVESAVGDPLEQSSKANGADALYTTSIPTGFPPEFLAANAQAIDANGNLCYYMPDLATNGLMIHMPPAGTTTPGSQQNQYYFPGITSAQGTGYPPPPPPPATEYEHRQDHRAATNGGSRRPKPRAPSAGARYHSSRGDGLHSPRKRSSVSNLPKVSSSDDTSGISAAAMTAPSTPRGHQLGRRSHSMQALPRTSPTPGGNGSGSFSTLPSGATTPSNNGAIRKRRSTSNMRRVSSTQAITSLTAAAAIATAVGASTTEPKTPSRRQRSTSVEANRPQSSSSNGGGGLNIGFVNFTANDHSLLMNGVAPSGSSKTKARRERELQEKTRKFSERLVRAMAEAGDGDAAMRKLEAEGFNDLGSITL